MEKFPQPIPQAPLPQPMIDRAARREAGRQMIPTTQGGFGTCQLGIQHIDGPVLQHTNQPDFDDKPVAVSTVRLAFCPFSFSILESAQHFVDNKYQFVHGRNPPTKTVFFGGIRPFLYRYMQFSPFFIGQALILSSNNLDR